MAQLVAGFGTSHTPMLNMPVEDWPHFVERDATRPHLDKEGRPRTFDQLLAEADPAMAALITPARMAERHAEVTASMRRLSDAVRRAELDALIVVGDDHKELYQDDNLPSIMVYRGDTIRNAPPRKRPPGGEWFARASARYYEAESPRDYPVARTLAEHLVNELIDREFDVATSDHLADGLGEGHAFGFVHKRLMDGATIPVVPIVLNTYYPPNQPTPRRCYRLGQAMRAAVESLAGNARVGIIASGGLSHFTVDEELDGAVIAAMRNKDAAALESLPRHKLNSGSSEIRNWICAAGALEHLKLDWLTYVPGYRTLAGTGTGMCFAAWT
jgi:hypothetical protein